MNRHEYRLARAVLSLFSHGLLYCEQGVGHGNVSARSYITAFHITPTGVGCTPVGALVPPMVYIEMLKSTIMMDSKAEPSSDVLLHYEIYKRLSLIRSIVHFHNSIVYARLPFLEMDIKDKELPDIIEGLYRNSYGPCAFSLLKHENGCIVLADTLDNAVNFAIGLKETFEHAD